MGYKCGSSFMLSVSIALINATRVLQDQYESLWLSRKLEAKHVDGRENCSIKLIETEIHIHTQ